MYSNKNVNNKNYINYIDMRILMMINIMITVIEVKMMIMDKLS